MKKRIFRFFMAILYIVLVAAMLLCHTQMIMGQTQRILATVETIMLAVSAIIVLILYIRLNNSNKPQISETGSPPQINCLEQFEERIKMMQLTERETEAAWLLYRGYTNRQIAEELCIAETTVKKHVSHIYEKVQVTGRKEYKEKIKNL